MRDAATGDNGTRYKYNKGAMAIHLETVYEQGVSALSNRLPGQSIGESV